VTIIIREATEGDLPGILAIHNDAILNGTAIWSTKPVDIANRAAILAERRAKSYPFLVADREGSVAGYASFGDFRPHDGYFKTVEHSVYVHKDHHRAGIGSLLMAPLIEAARAAGKHVMVGGIDATNASSIRFHERYGFVETGRMPAVGYKFGRYLDLVWMQKILD
jgi:phosphinothricin acetyltransferase